MKPPTFQCEGHSQGQHLHRLSPQCQQVHRLSLPITTLQWGLHTGLHINTTEDSLEPYPMGSLVLSQLETTNQGEDMLAPGTMFQVLMDSDSKQFYQVDQMRIKL
jgi:hypothetical protein